MKGFASRKGLKGSFQASEPEDALRLRVNRLVSQVTLSGVAVEKVQFLPNRQNLVDTKCLEN